MVSFRPGFLFERSFLLPALVGALALAAPDASLARPVVGWTERVTLSPSEVPTDPKNKVKISVIAKLDTGADYSSLDASDFEEFKKDGKNWVRFTVTSPTGEKQIFEERVIRTALIKHKGAKSQRRNVIRLGICLGSTYQKADVNLVDRSNFKMQMLLGRNFLAGNVSIDPALSFTTKPSCKIGS